MTIKYPGVPAPKPDVDSLFRTVLSLYQGYQAMTGVPTPTNLEVYNVGNLPDSTESTQVSGKLVSIVGAYGVPTSFEYGKLYLVTGDIPGSGGALLHGVYYLRNNSSVPEWRRLDDAVPAVDPGSWVTV